MDEHRERLKEKIDDIALAIIDKIKKHEEVYLKNLNENVLVFDYSKSLKDELADIQMTFRDPNLLIQSIKEIQRKQEESLKVIQLKLAEMNQIKDNLMGTNKFKQNLSLLNQTEGDTSLYGLINSNG